MNLSAPTCGPWTGFYNCEAGGQRYRMDLSLTFVEGIVSGLGGDRIGVFGIGGRFDSQFGEIHWTKTYFGSHLVRYRGFIEGGAIWGTWESKGTAKGGFHIWPLGKMVEYELDEPAAWPGMKPAAQKLQR